MRPLRLLVLAVHPERVAATRLRALQFRDGFARHGIELRSWTFLHDADLGRWFGRSTAGRVLAVLRGLLRVPSAVVAIVRADVVLVQREALPLGPPLLEVLATRLRPTIWDVDDSIWVPFVSPTAGRVPQWLRATGDKYRTICRRATTVWAGSEVLAAWCRAVNDDVHVVPTVVEVPAERPAPPARRTVGWVGSHSTGPFLESLLPVLADVDPVPTAVVVGADVAVPGAMPAEVRPWSPEAEERALAETRVGLYPVDRDHPLAEGKCGLKAILFMSHGIPVVATPTTTNAAVVRDGVDGLHAGDDDAWRRGVASLLDDDDLWERCSRAAHARALAEFSVSAWAPRLAEEVLALGGQRSRV